MDFNLTDEQQMLRKMVREFALEQIAPSVKERDKEARFDRALFTAMGELGLTGIVIPETYGGAGMDYLSYSICLEELSRVDPSIGVTLSVHVSLGCVPIYRFGSEFLKTRYLPKLTSGDYLAAYALSEPDAGSDVQAMKLTARAVDSGYILNGTKTWITSGGHADIYIVFARTDDGMTCFVVDKELPGFTVGKKEDKLGLRSSATTEIIFDDVFVSDDHVLGEAGEGFKVAMAALDGGRMGIASQAVGIAQSALDHALDYANTRSTFGKKIILHQGIGFMLSDMAAEIQAARLVTRQAAWYLSEGRPSTMMSSMAKLLAGDIAMKAAVDAVQIFGGNGYTTDYPVERIMRDAKITQIYEGTQQIQRLVISRQLMH
ncbi:acyl-CoA dehydrogenase [Macrococcus equipercicus]|uniref:Acyl-CoA dehydrogenase n=1 Tax=Macrococcus equipercicus TaxID=69967 RepID=A0A9Q9BT82_9STAP|nr:acyl-CoA dehydrogenase [Macrococcus equipercicus]KAA1039275.1 acyl-CoA dehydrogenase [Macrococcus equipercicus]UTH13566.1 acyl-CoA dehydrogenase [Macrococcus equipercicus]